MTHVNPIWLEAQRKRFTRPDAWRFAAPGTLEAKMPGWLDPSATCVRLKEAQEEEARAQAEAVQEEFECALLELRWLVKSLRTDLLLRDLRHKHNPDQPRVPAGNPDGGQWTSGDDGAGNGDVRPASGEAPQNNESLAQELRRFPASDQPPRSDRQQLEAVANDPLIRAYMDEAWLASNPYGIYPNEHGFWISRDEVSGQLFTRPFANPGVGSTIVPGPPPPDAIAFFHTHPYGGIQPGAAPPSPGDEVWATQLGLPGLIQSHVGMYYFGPALRPGR